MKKLERRAILCLALAAVLMAGIVFYVMKLTEEGGAWVSYPANQHIYKNENGCPEILIYGRYIFKMS